MLFAIVVYCPDSSSIARGRALDRWWSALRSSASPSSSSACPRKKCACAAQHNWLAQLSSNRRRRSVCFSSPANRYSQGSAHLHIVGVHPQRTAAILCSQAELSFPQVIAAPGSPAARAGRAPAATPRCTAAAHIACVKDLLSDILMQTWRQHCVGDAQQQTEAALAEDFMVELT